MANTKQITIIADVPYDWASELTAEEGHIFFVWTSSPVIGLHLSYQDLGYVPNEHGGKTSMHRLIIEGIEAVKWGALESMMTALRRVGRNVVGQGVDLDDGNQAFEF